MTDEEFWADVAESLQPQPIGEPDEPEEYDQEDLMPFLNECPECGSTVACGYDTEGRPWIHLAKNNRDE